MTAVRLLTDPYTIATNEQTGTAYTLAADDSGKVVECNNADPFTLTVPNSTNVAIDVGTVIAIYQAGAGTVTVEGATGVTVRNAGALSGQYAEASLRKRDTDEWVLTGALA